MKSFLSFYNLKLPIYLVYMLQQVEYTPDKLFSWIGRVINNNQTIQSTMTRKKLDWTKKAFALVLFNYVLAITLLVAPFVLSIGVSPFLLLVFIVVALPLILVSALIAVTIIAYKLIVNPKNTISVRNATKIYTEHKAVKIAVLGSYGKTTMKELLVTVLGEGLKVASTPGNMNVLISHARFTETLSGDEDVIIVEFGEGEPGDIARMLELLSPDYAIITGLAPNHLDYYPTLASVANDFLEVYNYVDNDAVFVSGESDSIISFIPKNAQVFTADGALGWKVDKKRVSVDSLTFSLAKKENSINVVSNLIGEHQIAPLSLIVALSDRLGLSNKQIYSGLAKTKPFGHRMLPRFIHGAWLIDDTYNGNIEGMKAGLKLLKQLNAKRKWYVTPGLVDQGAETENVHEELGRTIASANPDIVILMDNSVRPIIQQSMEKNGFKGELQIEKNPLEFYSNIEHVIVAGDIMLMQNDWTDNYN